MTDSQISVVPIEVIQDKRLTLEQTRVLVALFSFRNKVTNTVWPSRAAIAERTGMHPSNISSATTALATLGWLTKEGLGGFSKSTRYTLSVPDIVNPAPVARKATVAPSAAVAPSATAAPSATLTVAHSATTPLADSATRTEEFIEQSIEQSNSSQAPTALSQPSVPAVIPAPKKAPKAKATPDDTELQTACRATWAAYSDAYALRYGVAPVRNAKVNTAIKSLVQRLGHAESPAVAEFFVGSVNDAFVVRKMHDVGLLLASAESYRTQWATGRAMTTTRAQQADKTQSNFDSAQGAKALLRARNAE